MGIEQLFSSIEENNITNLDTHFTYKLAKKLETDYLLIDFNSIAHITTSTVLADINYLLYQIIKNTYRENIKFKKLISDYGLALNTDEITISDLKNIIDPDINNIMLSKIQEYLENILTNFIDNNKLEYLYIGIDGVPTKSKILEQKKRRYLGLFIQELKKKILDKYSQELDKPRYLFETNKFFWSKLNISPGTNFMVKLDNFLKSDFKKNIKKICPNLKSYIYSDISEIGEGEKKIVDFLKLIKIKKLDKFVIYSPDSDMTLLGLLLNISNLKILRYNSQLNNYDVINLDNLSNNLFNYIQKNTKYNLEKYNIIQDLVLILTILGNDFVPKIESINIKLDFDIIINKYIEYLSTNKYIINIQQNTKIINQTNFIGFLKILAINEGGNLQKIYISNHYQNYNKLKKILGANNSGNFNKIMVEFLAGIRKLNSNIRNNILDYKYNPDFLDKLKKITWFNQNKYFENNSEFLENYINYYKTNNRFPQIRIRFKKYSDSVNSEYHRQILEKSLDYLDPNLKITNYDTEIYKLDNMLDEYSKKLNSGALELGYTNINQNYIFITENISKGVSKYYYDFFGINNINPDNPELQKIISEYITGLIWVFEYYFNNNQTKPDIWFYKYSHAPLLKQIYNYLKNLDSKYILNIQNNLKNYQVDQKNYFNCLEHLLYVTPAKSYLNIIPPEFHKFVYKNNYFLDLNKIVDQVWSNNISDEIDCRGVLFLNKCHLTQLYISENILENYKSDLKFLGEIRKIKISKNTENLACKKN